MTQLEIEITYPNHDQPCHWGCVSGVVWLWVFDILAIRSRDASTWLVTEPIKKQENIFIYIFVSPLGGIWEKGRKEERKEKKRPLMIFMRMNIDRHMDEPKFHLCLVMWKSFRSCLPWPHGRRSQPALSLSSNWTNKLTLACISWRLPHSAALGNKPIEKSSWFTLNSVSL